MSGRTLRWMASLLHHHGRTGRPRLTIIRHHRVYADGERPLYRLGVSERVLRAQLELLVRLGHRPLSVGEGLARIDRGEPGHWVAMSFDDGYLDNIARALPLLEGCGAHATLFLAAGLIEERRAPWWDVLATMIERTRRPLLRGEWGGRMLALPLGTREERGRALRALLPALRVTPERQRDRLEAIAEALDVPAAAPCELADWEALAAWREAGLEIGAHTLTHPFLSLLPSPRQREEITGSVTLIRERLQIAPAGFAYPNGDYDATCVCIVAGSGLRYAVTTRGGDNVRSTPRFELRRRGLSEGACLGPDGRFSPSLATAELDGAFDRVRGLEALS
jgi:peptidoglycan/xylan/chitin deacetylase (PgdA/CDA1 family)